MKKVQLVISLMTLILVACGDITTDENKDTILSINENDTLINEQEAETSKINPEIQSLLESPLDLPAYKEEYGNSNSGHVLVEEVYYKPDTTGFYYQYMLFWKLGGILPNHPTESELFENFSIIVYKYGDKVGRFSDTNEELIRIKCALDNPTLGELNWYGKSTNEIENKYGAADFKEEDVWIYSMDGKTISCHFKEDKVNWFQFVRLKETIDLNEGIPDILLEWR